MIEAARLNITSELPSAFVVDIERRDFGVARLSRFSGWSFDVSFPAQEGEWISCLLPLEGAVASGGLPTGLATPAHIVFVPAGSAPLRASTPARFLDFSLEARLLYELFPTRIDAPTVVSKRPGIATAVMAFAVDLLDNPAELSAIENYAAGQLLAEMMASLLLDAFGVGLSSARETGGLRDQAMAVIMQRRADVDLTVGEVAREVSVSARRLQAVFADAGSTVTAEIRKQRATLAISLLSSSRYDVLSIDEIAERAGFGSPLSMRRALAELHGVSPTEVRRNRG